MKIGYAYVSTQDQLLHLQVDALQANGRTDYRYLAHLGVPASGTPKPFGA